MKKIILCALGALCLCSCEKQLDVYSNPDCYLNLRFVASSTGEEMDSESIKEYYDQFTIMYNFKTHGDITQDTVWVDASISGFVKDNDRTYSVEQIAIEGEDNAVAGTDYKAFNDPSVANLYTVKAGEVDFRIPVVLLRSASLKSKSVKIRLRIKANENFKNGIEAFQQRDIVFTDRLTKPAMWDEAYLDYCFGAYGDVKYLLMIEWSGKPWDDEYITELINGDNAYITYLDQVFAKRLEEENAKRIAAGLDVYKEADGTPVDFTPMSWW